MAPAHRHRQSRSSDPSHTRYGHRDGHAYIWAVVDPSLPTVPRDLRIYGTGWELPADFSVDKYKFINTFFEGPLVWHLFEVKN